MEKIPLECDIIIPVWNQLDYTEICLDSVVKYTRIPCRIIIVDNGSDRETAQYLDSVKAKNPEQVILIRNTENLGFVKAANQGIKESSSPYICLLNNDTQVTDGWLTEMIKVAESRKDIGIVNANSNTLGCKPKKGQFLQTFARELKSYSREYNELAWATGFCMLIKRKVIQEIGFFDEIYGMGNFEDADFSKRAQVLGYICVCAKAAYVYHRERRSFIKFKKFDKDFKRNRQIFFDKWGRSKRILYVLTKDSSSYTQKVANDALKLARRGNVIWIFLKDGNRQEINHHSNIYVYSLPKFFLNPVIFWRILKRKKKFDKIFVDDASYGKRLNRLKCFHRAEVIYAR